MITPPPRSRIAGRDASPLRAIRLGDDIAWKWVVCVFAWSTHRQSVEASLDLFDAAVLIAIYSGYLAR